MRRRRREARAAQLAEPVLLRGRVLDGFDLAILARDPHGLDPVRHDPGGGTLTWDGLILYTYPPRYWIPDEEEPCTARNG